MVDRADQIRRKIAHYRRQLAEGINGERAVEILREVRRLETELARIEGGGDKQE